jgi:hypothetical protein
MISKKQARENQRVNFAFTYIGPEPPSALLDSMDAKTMESFTDSRGFTHAFMITNKPKRATNVEETITLWNAEQLTDAKKIRLHPFPGEDSIVTFSKTPGHTPVDHFIVKNIKEARLNSKAGYRFWSSQDSFATQAQPTKKRSLERELGIDMVRSYSRQGTHNTQGGGREEPDANVTDANGASEASSSINGHSILAPAIANNDAENPPFARIIAYEVVDPNSPDIIQAKDEEIRSKDDALAKCTKTIKQKDEEISKHVRVIQSQIETVAMHEEVIQSQNQTIAKCEETIQSKNDSISKYREVIKSKDQVIAAQQVAIDALRMALEARRV